jgi:hypothetical protein
MKTLKESILAGMDDTISSGDDYVKGVKEEMRGLNAAIGSTSIYTKLNSRIYINGRRCTMYFTNLLTSLGYDANAMELTIYQLEDDLKDWHIDVFLYKRDGGCTSHSAYEHTIYLYNGHFEKFNDILKKLLKPATKDSDSFVRFLNKLAQYEGQLVMREDQLLK